MAKRMNICDKCYNTYNTVDEDGSGLCLKCRKAYNKETENTAEARIKPWVCCNCGEEYFSIKEKPVCDTCQTLEGLHVIPEELGVVLKVFICKGCGAGYKALYRSKLGLCRPCRRKRDIAKKSEKYHSDPEYRKKVLERAHDRYYEDPERFARAAALREKQEMNRKRDEDIYWRMKTKEKAEQLADMYGVSVNTIYRINSCMKRFYGERR